MRAFFGQLYICIPHFFLLFFLSIWSGIIHIIAFFSILFTGKYPESLYAFQVGYINWYIRVYARLYHLADGYPVFGTKERDAQVYLKIAYPEKISIGLTLLRFFFGNLYITIPHGFILFFRGIASGFLVFLAFWIVLFTGKYPEGMHAFNVGTMRWAVRVLLYRFNMRDVYPPFTGKPESELDYE